MALGACKSNPCDSPGGNEEDRVGEKGRRRGSIFIYFESEPKWTVATAPLTVRWAKGLHSQGKSVSVGWGHNCGQRPQGGSWRHPDKERERGIKTERERVRERDQRGRELMAPCSTGSCWQF